MGVSHLPILIILIVVALIVFGPKRLPELGHGLGKAITEFKKGTAELAGHQYATGSAEPVQPVAAPTYAPGEAAAMTTPAMPSPPAASPGAPAQAAATQVAEPSSRA